MRWKNKLGHDESSEIITILSKIRQGKFSILDSSDDICTFKIKLPNIICGLVFFVTQTDIKYVIKRESSLKLYKFRLKQINGIPEREIRMVDGYMIWGLLEEKL